jgi:anti-sigma factor RsiW
MRCLKDKLLQAYLDGELSNADSAELDRHIEVCPACREKLQQLRSASELVKEWISHLDPARIPAAPPLPIKKTQNPARVPPYWHRLAASSIRVPAAALAMAGIFVIGVSLGMIFKGSPRGQSEGGAGRRVESAQLSLLGADSVQVFPVGLDLKGYRPVERPNIFTIKE